MKTQKQLVHDWSSGELVIYEIEAPVTEDVSNPPQDDDNADR